MIFYMSFIRLTVGRPWQSPTITALEIMFRQRALFRSYLQGAHAHKFDQSLLCSAMSGRRMNGLTLVNSNNEGFHHPAGCPCDLRTNMDVGHACVSMFQENYPAPRPSIRAVAKKAKVSQTCASKVVQESASSEAP
jgi:hypothetical protein